MRQWHNFPVTQLWTGLTLKTREELTQPKGSGAGRPHRPLLPQGAKGRSEKWTWLTGTGEVQGTYKAPHAALTRSHHCSLLTRSHGKGCSSCHGELHSKVVSLSLPFPGEDRDLRGIFVSLFIGPCPSIRPSHHARLNKDLVLFANSKNSLRQISLLPTMFPPL